MKLKTIILENFRCYKNETRIELGNLTSFIGKNDIGKSSILEALEIFFNSNLVKIDKLDSCVFSRNEEIRIGCIFTDLPTELVLDVSSITNLRDEYLLNQEGFLEIHKIYNSSLTKIKETIYARANHPTETQIDDLLLLKNPELKKRLEELGANRERVDLRSNPSIRKAIWNSYKDLKLKSADIPLDKEDAKKIWDSLKKEMPTYALFKADRTSRDDDAEVQDPMKLAVLEAIRSVENEIEKIKKIVREKATEVAQRTLDKLREMNAELANELSPNFKAEPKWDNLFKLTLTGDNHIPINKRGSGVRRLILINFFRAEAERKQKATDSPGIIYAIEEPETSQHPHSQKMLVEALVELSERDNCEVILTTHVPGLAGFLPKECLRYIEKDEHNVIHISSENEDVYKKIANDLGVLPDNRIKVFICVEGPNDIRFLKHISTILHKHDDSLPDIGKDPRITFIPMGGSTLNDWVQNHYLKETGRPEIHIYDRGISNPPKFYDICIKVNSRNDGSWATLTKKREIENYLHPEAIYEIFNVNLKFGENDNVPMFVAKAVHESDPHSKPWNQLKENEIKKKESRIKKRLNDEVASRMTYNRLTQCDPSGEIAKWLKEIAKRLA